MMMHRRTTSAPTTTDNATMPRKKGGGIGRYQFDNSDSAGAGGAGVVLLGGPPRRKKKRGGSGGRDNSSCGCPGTATTTSTMENIFRYSVFTLLGILLFIANGIQSPPSQEATYVVVDGRVERGDEYDDMISNSGNNEKQSHHRRNLSPGVAAGGGPPSSSSASPLEHLASSSEKEAARRRVMDGNEPTVISPLHAKNAYWTKKERPTTTNTLTEVVGIAEDYDDDDKQQPPPLTKKEKKQLRKAQRRELEHQYDQLRRQMSQILYPEDGIEAMERRRHLIQNVLHENEYRPLLHDDNDHNGGDVVGYDIYDCPTYPPNGYPYQWKLVDEILTHWPVDDTFPPPPPRPTTTSSASSSSSSTSTTSSKPYYQIHQGICQFDYTNINDRIKAQHYREAEVPFILVNDDEIHKTVERWNHPNYMSQLLTEDDRRVDGFTYSQTNHFMFYRNPSDEDDDLLQAPPDWKPPTDEISKMTFDEWYNDIADVPRGSVEPNEEHVYVELPDDLPWLQTEMPYFDPKNGHGFYMVNPEENDGIDCRLGMTGVIAECHYDGGRNFVAVFKGERRYILASPDQCPNLGLYPDDHPSRRHSRVNWSHPHDDSIDDICPEFRSKAMANEVVLRAGDVLYIPSYYFHFIVSLDLSYQCNSRCGHPDKYEAIIDQCSASLE